MTDERPKGGWRYVIATGFEATVLTHWSAPFTGGEQKYLPPGLEFEVINDPPFAATAVGAKPDPYERWEVALVDDNDRKAEKYAGYSLVIQLVHLAKRCVCR